MRTKTIIVFTRDEVLKILQDYYNKENGTNHALIFTSATIKTLNSIVELQLNMWNKDEKSH